MPVEGIAVGGLAVFYGLDRAAKVSRRQRREAGEADATSPSVFWLRVASFGA